MRDFQDKVAFVTGGASGLGFALGRAFGRARMKVMLAISMLIPSKMPSPNLKRIKSVSAASNVTYLIVHLYSALPQKP